MQKHLIIFLLILASAIRLTAAPSVSGGSPAGTSGTATSFVTIDSRDGLAQNNVKAIAQDSRGFIWLGTKNGLCRYDGRQVQTFRVLDSRTGAANQNVSALCTDSQGRLWVGTDEYVFLYDPTTETFRHIDIPAQDGQSMNKWVAGITEDATGDIWITVPEEGLYRIHTASDGSPAGASSPSELSLRHYPAPNTARGDHFSTLCTTPEGEIWVSGWNIGLWYLDRRQDRFLQVSQDADGRSLLNLQTNTLCDYHGALILAVQNGRLLAYDRQNRHLADASDADFSGTVVRGAWAYNDDLLVGTYAGLYLLSAPSPTASIGSPAGTTSPATPIQHFFHNLNDPSSLSDDIVYTTFRDREGGTWVGTMFGGVSYLPPRPLMFSTITHDAAGHHLSSDRIREMALTGNTLYVGTDDHGLNRIDLTTGNILPDFATLPAGADDITLCTTIHDGILYQSINKTGIKVVPLATGKPTLLTCSQLHLPEGSTVYDLLFDSRGRTWLATDWGVWLAPAADITACKSVEDTREFWVYDLLEDRNGNIWAASMGSGLFRIDAATSKVRRYIHDPADPASLSSNSISSLFEDSRGLIWASTDRGGLCAYNPADDTFRRYSTEEGLPDDVAYAVLEDATHHLWFGTNRGLVRLNPETSQIQVFTTRHGLPGNQFNYKAALAAPDGTFYLGTTNGLVACRPILQPATTDAEVPLLFTRLAIGGTETKPATPGSPLEASITEASQLRLPYDHAAFSIDVAYLSYAAAKATTYSYRLAPIDREWTSLPDGAPVAFANLAPGDYTLHLRATTLEGGSEHTTERTLRITVLPPWWQSWWAYLVYAVLLATAAYLWFRWYRRRKEAQFAERQRLYDIQKEKELGERKVQFFTEIAHEIRTPLTLISGPLEAIMTRLRPEERQSPTGRNLSVIQQNTERLMGLATQLLDFQKAGTGELQLHPEATDATELLRQTVARFEPTFAHKGKQLTMQQCPATAFAYIDREATTKIISNLLTNALKYANSCCQLTLSATPTSLQLHVFSDGTPIPADQQQAVFDPFVQLADRKPSQGGVGIGLALCQRLATMQGGHLTLTTSPEGNTFSLSLPATEALPAAEEARQTTAPSGFPAGNLPAPTTAPSGSPAGNQPSSPAEDLPASSPAEFIHSATILLVDDEQGLLDFIAERLREDFAVITASDGQQALDILPQEHIDLIISDVMMPNVDGIELCRRIKSDVTYSHIPIILLTAKNDIEAKVQGLRVGAEAYIEKPFAWDYLRQQVISLLTNRQKEREAFAKRPFFPMKNMQMSHEDEEFMSHALEVINQHIADENFNVEAMAEALCMSRSSLLRKIKTLFDMPPLDFIRLIRLKHAAALIQEGRYRMGEICERVGFSSHSYFSKLFARQFGMMPKEFEQQVAQQRERLKDLRHEPPQDLA